MDKPAGWIVRPKDMKAMQHELNRVRSNTGDLWAAARTLVGWAEPQQTQQTQLPPASVASLALPPDEPVNVPADPDVESQPYDMPSPEAAALDRIAEASEIPFGLVGDAIVRANFIFWATVRGVLYETGRL